MPTSLYSSSADPNLLYYREQDLRLDASTTGHQGICSSMDVELPQYSKDPEGQQVLEKRLYELHSQWQQGSQQEREETRESLFMNAAKIVTDEAFKAGCVTDCRTAEECRILAPRIFQTVTDGIKYLVEHTPRGSSRAWVRTILTEPCCQLPMAVRKYRQARLLERSENPKADLSTNLSFFGAVITDGSEEDEKTVATLREKLGERLMKAALDGRKRYKVVDDDWERWIRQFGNYCVDTLKTHREYAHLGLKPADWLEGWDDHETAERFTRLNGWWSHHKGWSRVYHGALRAMSTCYSDDGEKHCENACSLLGRSCTGESTVLPEEELRKGDEAYASGWFQVKKAAEALIERDRALILMP